MSPEDHPATRPSPEGPRQNAAPEGPTPEVARQNAAPEGPSPEVGNKVIVEFRNDGLLERAVGTVVDRGPGAPGTQRAYGELYVRFDLPQRRGFGLSAIALSSCRVVDAPMLRVDVAVGYERNWATNGIRFASLQDAQEYARDLGSRWTMVRGWRVVEESTPEREPIDEGTVQS
jgi:hypothetical protein